MTRGVRGATTIQQNEEKQILDNTKELVEEMVDKNQIQPSDISHVFISLTSDINASFPARALRQMPGWTYVPVMHMAEADVPDSLSFCIRIMMVINTDKAQKEIAHVYLNNAKSLRPDLTKENGDTVNK